MHLFIMKAKQPLIRIRMMQITWFQAKTYLDKVRRKIPN
jgi:hypothetical protein